MLKRLTAVALVAFTLTACDGGGAREYVWAAGSSTVFPYATRVAENYARKNDVRAPKIESLGTGGGIKLFCEGPSDLYPDIALASRPMKASEFDECMRNGVGQIIELTVGYDGVVIAGDRRGADFDLTREQIYRALAAAVPQGNGFVPNPNRTWRQVDPSLPDQRIQVYGPPPTSGTRDAFGELAMEPGAREVPVLAALRESDEDAFKERATRLREDGGWIDAGENDNAIVGTVLRTPGALGVFGYAFLEQNATQIKGAMIGGVTPTAETIASGDYPLSRSLYIYVKARNVGVTPGLREYLAEFMSDAAGGPRGYLPDRGMIPLPAEMRSAQRQAALSLTPMQRPER